MSDSRATSVGLEGVLDMVQCVINQSMESDVFFSDEHEEGSLHASSETSTEVSGFRSCKNGQGELLQEPFNQA